MPTNHDETLQERYQREVGGLVICAACLGSGDNPHACDTNGYPICYPCDKCDGTGMTKSEKEHLS